MQTAIKVTGTRTDISVSDGSDIVTVSVEPQLAEQPRTEAEQKPRVTLN